MPFKNISLIFVIISIVISCQTQTKSPEKSSIPIQVFASKEDQYVVHRVKSKFSTLSPLSQDDIKELLSKNNSDSLKKIFALLSSGDFLQAQRLSRLQLQKTPNNPVYIFALANSLALNQQYTLASYYAKQIQNVSQFKSYALNILALNQLANAKFSHQVTEATNTFIEAFNASEKNVAAGFNLAQLYLDTGAFLEAKSIYQRTLLRCNQCYKAKLGLAISAVRTNDEQKATSIFNEILQENENDLLAMYYLAVISYSIKNNPNAAKNYLAKIINNQIPGYTTIKERAEYMLAKVNNQPIANDEYINKNTGASAYSDKLLFGSPLK